MKIAMVSEHASPLAVLGGVDAGGQNVHVAELSGALADRGHRVTVYTRRDDAGQPVRVLLRPGVEVAHVDAGPARHVPKDELFPYMGR
ncbi:glycosyltransferase, partial [Curtobacterium sp. B18]|uniref:glycosyltransferase n=1 Tax=Curtobacterium sp. B18 TaxID=95614 RepID=UPI0004CF7474